VTAQKFVSALSRPWVLIRVQGNGQPGHRPPTSVAWLEYDSGAHFDGGPVYFGRDRQWWFQYKHQQKIGKDRILHVFPNYKDRYSGPTPTQIKQAKQALPVIAEEVAHD
jgi:hypothetical protein